MSTLKNYIYETKCRRCGTVTEWFFSTADIISWRQFVMAMNDYIANPRQSECKECKKKTVQDVISYTE